MPAEWRPLIDAIQAGQASLDTGFVPTAPLQAALFRATVGVLELHSAAGGGDPLLARGVADAQARERAAELLTRLQIAEKMWSLPPSTFSGGEQQRINIARGFAADYPILLLDEPTASLDEQNRKIVINLIDDARRRGTAIVAIVHDAETRAAITTRLLPLQAHGVAA